MVILSSSNIRPRLSLYFVTLTLNTPESSIPSVPSFLSTFLPLSLYIYTLYTLYKFASYALALSIFLSYILNK